ncbi:MAG TPA: hypothetical protein VKZ65_01110 [Glycomyces sp.]|nr:hypothetical protein [Glycomyces sp.]
MDASKPTDSSRQHGSLPPPDPSRARLPAEFLDGDVAFEAMKWLLRFDADPSRLPELGLVVLEGPEDRPGCSGSR